ncbi:helix-turn-helix transcriptional regulator [Necropsobacter rosorum]|uniref:helix-turn-helix transcriptional regulator n=1 Tax=Necropsobacter rosorum TaxID=908285 RepID=UPI003C798CD3
MRESAVDFLSIFTVKSPADQKQRFFTLESPDFCYMPFHNLCNMTKKALFFMLNPNEYERLRNRAEIKIKEVKNVTDSPKKARFINIDEVIDRTSLKKTTIYDLMKKQSFPQSIRLAQNRIAWLESEIDDWIEHKIKANKES